MIKIMLACTAGVSTTLLVTRMNNVAKEAGLEAQIWATSELNLADDITKCDVLLVGPQVRYVLNKAKKLAAPHGIPVEVIDVMHYGRCNGKAVLNKALELKKYNL